MEEIKCECCDSSYEEEYYKYEDKIYCFDCLTEKLEADGRIHIVKTIHYYNEDWGTLGTDDEINEVVQNLCEEFEVETIES